MRNPHKFITALLWGGVAIIGAGVLESVLFVIFPFTVYIIAIAVAIEEGAIILASLASIKLRQLGNRAYAWVGASFGIIEFLFAMYHGDSFYSRTQGLAVHILLGFVMVAFAYRNRISYIWLGWVIVSLFHFLYNMRLIHAWGF